MEGINASSAAIASAKPMQPDETLPRVDQKKEEKRIELEKKENMEQHKRGWNWGWPALGRLSRAGLAKPKPLLLTK